ncbi:hypothetical protein [Bifidobacterium adolescentis]|uniref:hypothetical protein n=1 Tax=Bifidobacterium adolescentis TaxID=1680 RepID=UPI004064C7DA
MPAIKLKTKVSDRILEKALDGLEAEKALEAGEAKAEEPAVKERLLPGLIGLIADIKATGEQTVADNDPQEEKRRTQDASKAMKTLPAAERIAAGHGYDSVMIGEGHVRDIDSLARDMDAFWRECVREKDWDMAHEANDLLARLTLVESESWH